MIYGVLSLLATLLGLVATLALAVAPRLGPRSRLLALHLLGSAAAAAPIAGAWLLDWEASSALLASYHLLLLAVPPAVLYSARLRRPAGRLRGTQAFALAGPVLFAACVFAPEPAGPELAPEYLPIGWAGYAAALYLLAASIGVLVRVEQAFRASTEHQRWALKFLLLGLALSFGALVYATSKVLIYRVLPRSVPPVYPIAFLLTCPLALLSWRRSRDGGRIRLSQEAIYGSFTLIVVGVYLIVAALLAAGAGRLAAESEAAALVFFLALCLLAVVFLSTAFRHRVRNWIRRNVFAGRYDYRAFWMEAVERIQGSDPPEVAAAALAELVERSLGSLDVGVWLRVGRGSDFRLAARRGEMRAEPGEVAEDVLAEADGLDDTPARASSLPEGGALARVLERTRAVLVAPLRSGRETLGLLTCGPDRSGESFGREAGEFLRVLAGHAAGELHKHELLAARVAAQEAAAFRTFATFLLHDLKNFASTLSLIARNAVRHADNPAFREDAFRSVLDTAEKMKRLCNSLGGFSSSPVRGKEPCDLNTLVRATVDEMGAEVRLELGDPPEVEVDRAAVAGVLRNLVLNALEALDGAGAVTVRTGERGQHARFEVEDDGPGIPRDFLENDLFQPFRTTKSEGLGIGLFQARRIVEGHGGSISIWSEIGRGTRVEVSFPARQAVDSSPS